MKSPMIVVATVSTYEVRLLEPTLKLTGLDVTFVHTACEAEALLTDPGLFCVLVVDSGLLEAPSDPEWRELRERHPGVGMLVRSLVREPANRPGDAWACEVHPDDRRGLLRAIRTFCRLRSPVSASSQPIPAARVGGSLRAEAN